MKTNKTKLINNKKQSFLFLKPKTCQLKARGGFTLIETMVAIFILSFAITAPMTLVAKSLQASFFARDQIIAFYLAGEAIEHVRNVRDTNTLSNVSWLSGLADCRGGAICDVDVQNSTIVSCSGVCDPLLYDNTLKFYNHITGESSVFTREVRMGSINADEETVSVTVSWRTGLLSHSFNIKEHIFNWQ